MLIKNNKIEDKRSKPLSYVTNMKTSSKKNKRSGNDGNVDINNFGCVKRLREKMGKSNDLSSKTKYRFSSLKYDFERTIYFLHLKLSSSMRYNILKRFNMIFFTQIHTFSLIQDISRYFLNLLQKNAIANTLICSSLLY